jgi:hypothetical protein
MPVFSSSNDVAVSPVDGGKGVHRRVLAGRAFEHVWYSEGFEPSFD